MKSEKKIFAETMAEDQAAPPAERWRKPAVVAKVAEDPNQITYDGFTIRTGVRMTLTPETMRRVVAGYLCLGWGGVPCLEPQETAFPKECSLCGYPMRKKQIEDFNQQFEGEEWVGPHNTSRDRWEESHEGSERRWHNKDKTISVPRIWTPNSAA